MSSEFSELINLSVEKLYLINNISIYHKIFDFRISYLAPSYHMNRLEIVTNEFFTERIPEMMENGAVDDNDMSFATLDIQLELNSLLVAIKTSLDRLVYFVSRINKSVSPSTTFGRIIKEGKGRGLMSEVIKQKDDCDLMRNIYIHYIDWINEIVKPRDLVIHHGDLHISFLMDEEYNFTPIFSKPEKSIKSFGLTDLKGYVDKWIEFSSNFFPLFYEKL